MKGLPCSGVIVIRKAEKLALFPYNSAQGGIGDMTDLREEVMLYLKVQAAYKPGNYLVPGGKVGGSPDLMDGPFGIYKLVRFVGHIKAGLFNYMRQLKYYR